MAKKAESRQVGLEIAQIFEGYLFGTEDLHYGYWPDDLEVHVLNLAQAQANHSAFIQKHIPSSVRSILDVGGGAGEFARKLADAGYRVDCVTPSEHLAARIESGIHERSLHRSRLSGHLGIVEQRPGAGY